MVTTSTEQTLKLPVQLIWIIWLICLLPSALNVLGVSFASSLLPRNLEIVCNPASLGFIEEVIYQRLQGSFVHTILEWSAVCTAIFTIILAFAHFYIKSDIITPIIGVTLLCAGLIDAFHTLAADRLIEAVADNSKLIPFTWALCRLCNALVTIIGVSIFLFSKPTRWQGSLKFIVAVTLGFGLVCYGIIAVCATSHTLPQTIFPNSIITRPWDIIPLILFLVAGILIYPRFWRKYPSLFSHALIISTIPNVATQFHMVFGSTALFDNHFNIAHFLKIVAYLVPLAGLILDYIYAHRQLLIALKQAQLYTEARENAQLAQHTLSQLQQTQAQIIQTAKMSSMGQLVAGIAHEINNPVNFIYGNLNHIDEYTQNLLQLVMAYQQHYPNPPPSLQQQLNSIELDFIIQDLGNILQSMQVGTKRIRDIIVSLRNFSRLDEASFKEADIHSGIDNTLIILHHRLQTKADATGIKVIKEYGQLPLVQCYVRELNQVFMNILTNAIDVLEESVEKTNRQHKTPSIWIQTQLTSDNLVSISIADNGGGIPEEIRLKLFDPFFTTKPVGKGTGLGLFISYQIVVEKHGGNIWYNSTSDGGTKFVIEIPIQPGKNVVKSAGSR
ncbi:ATP-binding protein [Nostoc sp. NZL]|uniref:ATP-binding protein n=1 Tax=Nostoc sp. NZL TaxID=2650612 RepID=UPI002ED8CC6E|nr:histidine kinase [Nostoc sp. NZL]